MHLSRFVRSMKRKGHNRVMIGTRTVITIPPKGRIRSLMPVREARRFLRHRLYSVVRNESRLGLHWFPGMSTREAT